MTQQNQDIKATKSTTTSTNKIEDSSKKPFVSTLYVGFYKQHLYALPTFVYNWQTPLIDGPIITNDQLNDQHQIIPFPIQNEENSTLEDILDEFGDQNPENQKFF